MRKLTRQQEKVFNFVYEHIAQTGISPTIQQISKGVGLSSTSTAHRHVQNLIDKNYLTKEPKGARSLRVTEDARKEADDMEKLLSLDDDLTDLIKIKNQYFIVKRATDEEIKEWSGTL